MKALLTLLTILACLATVACEPEQSKVTTGSTEITMAARHRSGDIAPVLPLRTREGKLVELSEVAQPIMVVAFVDTEGDCDHVSPQLRQLAKDLNLDGVTVVQISEGCNDCKQLMEQTVIEGDNFMVLCDGKGVAMEAFRSPAAGNIYVIDNDDRIAYEATMSELPEVQRQAERVNKEYEEYLIEVQRRN